MNGVERASRNKTPDSGTKLPLKDDALADWITGRLDQTAVDAATLSQLNRSRNAALDRYDRRQGNPVARSGWWARPAVALVTLFAVTFWFSSTLLHRGDPGIAVLAPGQAELALADLDLLASDAELFGDEELEFYFWLEQQPEWQPSGPELAHPSG
ncbi:MAG TPA: hypothetical protein DCF45_02990 [Gammaproteobacteria bacterium]|nr:hypothetical protein [Gammaproteobacteria bacterium]